MLKEKFCTLKTHPCIHKLKLQWHLIQYQKNRHYDNIIFLDYKPIDIFLQAMLTGAIDLSNRTHTFDNLYTLYSKSVIATACAQDNFQNNQVSSSFLDYCARKSSTQEKHIEIQYETICHIVD